MVIEPWVMAVGGTVVAGLFALLGYLARSRIERVEKDLADAQRAFNEAITRERDSRERDRDDMRDAINGIGGRLAELREKVLSECINHERMAQAMKPVMDRLGEIRSDIKEIYGRLDRKVDKALGAD
jgi:chromosome segregation ATPase